jgi:uncharacterized Tic20 family protein
MDRQLRGYFQYDPDYSPGKAVRVCFGISVILAIVVAVVYLLTTIGSSDNGTVRMKGALGVAAFTLLVGFLLLSMIMAVGRRAYQRRHPPPPPPPPPRW